ncbi:MAG: hypothetical protein PHP30_00630 [Bacteroidales bacterium]|nr:hypothetical protein [Bacteroidales bacterium]MDD3988590.1 hypothetical protein [Bacteroidales bacterium]
MSSKRSILIIIIFSFALVHTKAQDSLSFLGQASAYTLIGSGNNLPVWSGGRYIPQLNYEINLRKNNLVDFEASANIWGNAGFRLFDTVSFKGGVSPYRLWARYSSSRLELRAGLQKINFGSASILRPLMWFDQTDNRDPLKLTEGVWGVLGRYYFQNNANIWLWCLYGNEKKKGWETLNTVSNIPEFGGRIQFPLPSGEAAFSYHHRTSEGFPHLGYGNPDNYNPENRYGFDAKFDTKIGWWFEASLTDYKFTPEGVNDILIFNLGADYTFGLGNGITVTFEQLTILSPFEKGLNYDNFLTFSLISASYPLGMFDNINTVIYYDWKNRKSYNFINWQRNFNKFTLNLMGYLNPDNYIIPLQGMNEISYAGKGFQVMIIFNH